MARFCPDCGSAASGYKFCSECGSDLRPVSVAGVASGLPALDVATRSPVPDSVDDSPRYRPSVPLTILAVLWWLFNAYPAASELADKQHQNDVVLPLVAVLLTSAAVAAMLRIGWMLAARRWRWREALTSPWMWVIAGGMCLVEFLGQVGRHG